MERCGKCGSRRREDLYSPLGVPVCWNCHTNVSGAAIGAMTGGLEGAIAGGHEQDGKPSGILAWIRRALGKGS